MATHPAYVSQYSVVAREVRARRLEVSQTVRWLGILVAIILVCLLYVGLGSLVNALGAEVQDLRDREAQLRGQNAELLVEFTRRSDPQQIAKQATDLGMVPAPPVEYWAVPPAQAAAPGAVPPPSAKAQTKP
ncbi:MAG: hypothetical protein FJZ89_00755 [Chloroflexi bacterium]|nr:hypothetical protein [Chloroflexota bacterium]